MWRWISSQNTIQLDAQISNLINALNCSLHSDLVSCVAWTTSEELYSCGDDHQILKWKRLSDETSVVAKLPSEIYATDIHFFPKSLSGKGKQPHSDIFVLSSADGELYVCESFWTFLVKGLFYEMFYGMFFKQLS